MSNYNETDKIYNNQDSPEEIYNLVSDRIKNQYRNKLYQYCSFNSDYDPYNRTEEIAQHNRYFQNVLDRIIFASKPSEFNDPFDSTIGLSDRSILTDVLKSFISPSYIETKINKSIIKEMFKDSGSRFDWIKNLEEQQPCLIRDILLYIMKNDYLYYRFNYDNNHKYLKRKPMNTIEKNKMMKDVFQDSSFQSSFIENFINEKYYNQDTAEKLRALFSNERLLVDAVLTKPITVNIDNNNIRDFDVSIDKMRILELNYGNKGTDENSIRLQKALKDASEIAFKGLQEFYSKFNNQFGITCFSKRSDIPLMWSHYAHKHTGFVIEYDFSNLTLEDAQKLAFLLPVKYDKKRRRLDSKLIKEYMDDHTSVPSEKLLLMFMELIYVKANEWKYEKEVRNLTKVEDFNSRKIPFKYAVFNISVDKQL